MISIGAAALGDLVGTIYRVVDEPRLGPELITNLRTAFGASHVCIQPHGQRVDCYPLMSSADPDYLVRLGAEPAYHTEGFSERLMAARPGQVYSSDGLFVHEAFRRSLFWNEWMAPQDMFDGLVCKVCEHGSSRLFVDIRRGHGGEAFGASEGELLTYLLPHIQRASELAETLALAAARGPTRHRSFGFLLLDDNMGIVRLDEAADRILSRPAVGLERRRGRLHEPSGRGVLRRLVHDACASRDGVVAGTGGNGVVRGRGDRDADDIAVSVSPALGRTDAPLMSRRLAVVVMRELSLDVPEGFERLLSEVFSFTAKEAAITAALAAGHSLAEAARLSRIGIGTARSHLAAAFRKTDTHRQSELVALVRSVAPFEW